MTEYLMKKSHTRNTDVQRNFSFETFNPPLECVGIVCPNIHCPSRKSVNVGKPCIYAEPKTNAQIQVEKR